MTQPAYIYARFSTQEQSEGDSVARQLSGARKFIADRGWSYSADREIVDEGKSAFHGKNRVDGGQLYQFEKKAAAGHFDNGAALVVENLDRLTRQGYEHAFEIVRLFTSHGVTVATWADNQIYPAHERIDMGKAMLLLAKAELALAESENKSKKLKSSWKARVTAAENGSGQAATSIVPGWLTVTVTREGGTTTRTIHPNPHRAAVLNEIFDWYCEGKSLPWIERELNTRREPTWGLGKHAQAKGWNVSTLHKYLTSRTVLGEYEPRTRVGKDRKVSKGIVIPDYYPQVIAPDKFNRVQALRKERQRWGGRNDFNLPNLFTNLATCFHCGGSLKQNGITKAGTSVTNKNKNGTTRSHTVKTNRSYLRCSNSLRGYKCENKRGYRYEPLEAGIIDVLIHWMERQTEFAPESKAGQLATSIAEQERHIALKRGQLDQIVANLMEVFSKALAQRASELEQEVERDEEQLTRTRRELEIVRGTSSPEESLAVLQGARSDLNHENDEMRYAARVQANQSLRRLVERMEGDQTGYINVKIGNALYLRFDPAGQCVEATPLADAIYAGADGELNWHPDDPEGTVYQYAS